MRYFLLRDRDTLEVYVSQDLEEQPENSIPFFENNLKNAVFNKYPNPQFIKEMDIDESVDIEKELVIKGIYQKLQENNIALVLTNENGEIILPTEETK